jgi:hypothetical protein
MSNHSQQGSFFWPTIGDSKAAQVVGRQGSIICVLIVLMTTVMAIVAHSVQSEGAVSPLMVTPETAIIVSLVYGGLAVMIYKMSRVAAVLGLLMYLFNCGLSIAQHGISAGLIVQILVVFTFINSVRGTFAYHCFRQERQKLVQEEVDTVR